MAHPSLLERESAWHNRMSQMRRHLRKPETRPHISWVDRIEYAVRSRGAKVVVLALVANTMVAQLLYN